MEPFKAPYFSPAELRQRAADFLAQRNPRGEVPVPIEHIVERMGVDIVPVPELMRNFSIDGWTTHDMKEIYVDEYVYDNVENRYRFTLAHEVGHIVLHSEVFKPYEFRSVEQWRKFVESVDDKQWDHLEHHANIFAAHVLMPTPELVRIYRGCSETIRREAPRIAEDPAALRHFVALCVSKVFRVSADSAEIRISNEPLLQGIS